MYNHSLNKNSSFQQDALNWLQLEFRVLHKQGFTSLLPSKPNSWGPFRVLWTKHTSSFSPQRKPRHCSPAHFEVFLNTDPNPVPKACSCYISECRISKPLRGEVGDNVIFGALYDVVSSLAQSQRAISLLSWPSGWHKEEKCTVPLQSRQAPASLPTAAAAAPGPADALIPATTPHQANRACYF